MPTCFRIAHLDGLCRIDDHIIEKVEEILNRAAGEWTSLLTFSDGSNDIKAHYYDIFHDIFGIPFNIPAYNGRLIIGGENENLKDIASFMLIFLRTIPIYEANAPQGNYYHGEYFSKAQNNRPHIKIYSDNITDNDFEKHAVTTIIHELAHAVMDPCNYYCFDHNRNVPKYFDAPNEVVYSGYVFPNLLDCASCTYRNNHNIEEGPLSFYKFREESLANIITLNIIRTAGTRNGIGNQYTLEWLNNLFSHQPCEYRLAATYYIRFQQNIRIPVDIIGWLRAKIDRVIPQESANEWMLMACRQNRLEDISQLDNGMPWMV